MTSGARVSTAHSDVTTDYMASPHTPTPTPAPAPARMPRGQYNQAPAVDDANPFEGGASIAAAGGASSSGPPSHSGSHSGRSSPSPSSSRSPSALSSMGTFASGMFSSLQSRMPAALSSFEIPNAGDTNAYFAQQAATSAGSQLHKVLDWKDLISLGVGCTIGAGIFVVTGVVAATKAGPALFLCYIVSGIACALAGLCYSELAAMAPSAGSAYSYARASMGQTVGWIIGWDLTLEYAVSGASVAQGWSKYFNALLHLIGMGFPPTWSQAPWTYDPHTGSMNATGAVCDLPALCITLAITLLLVRGTQESARFAQAMVALKVAVVLFVTFVGAAFVKKENYEPFMPFGFFGISFFGHTAIGSSGPDGSPVGVFAGAAIVFFAYIGFDSVTCQAEETKNPQRDLPIGIIGSLSISTVLYVAVSLVLVGMVPYDQISLDAPMSDAFGRVGLPFAEAIIAVGAIVGITSVLLVTLMGQPRIMLSMARDGLLPESFFCAVHPTYGTPHKSTLLTGVLVGLIASLVPLSVLVELVSIGTLLAFTIVCIAVLVLRRTAPHVPRAFKCPFTPWVPLGGAFTCIMLMLSLPSSNWIRLLVWLGIGMLIYIFYGHANAAKVRAARAEAASVELEAGGQGVSGGTGAGAAGLADADALLLDPPSSISFDRNIFEEGSDADVGAGAADTADRTTQRASDDVGGVAHQSPDTGLSLSEAALDGGQQQQPQGAEYVSPASAARQARKGLLRQQKSRDPEERLSDDVMYNAELLTARVL